MYPLIPRKLRIGRRDWQVYFHNDQDLPQRFVAEWQKWENKARAKSGKLGGLTYYETRVIIIRNEKPAWRMWRAFVHELMHACSKRNIPLPFEELFISEADTDLARTLANLTWRNARELRRPRRADEASCDGRGRGKAARSR